MLKTKDLISLRNLSPEDIWTIIETAKLLKADLKMGKSHRVLDGRTLAMIFQKPSLRTRVSFETGMTQLGGHAIYLGPEDIKLGQRETTEDIAKVTSRYVDIIMARVFGHKIVENLARHATVPVINGLSDLLHPCQILGDLLTIYEKKRELKGLTIAFIGDGNNVANSWLNGGPKMGIAVRIACPEGFEPDEQTIEYAKAQSPDIKITHDPKEAAQKADLLYTDVWASMGEEKEADQKKVSFAGFQINKGIIKIAKPECLVMHCLPAHYGEEITEEAAKSPNSVIYDQAENRMHAQKALLVLLLNKSII